MGPPPPPHVPSFLVVGAPRCGTTSLHYYLRQHPQVCMTDIKEPNHFLFDGSGEPWIEEPPIIRKSVRSSSDYSALFRPAPGEVALGDVSPLYLYTAPTPERVLDECGPVQVVAVVRRPAERAWSHFLHAFADVPAERQAAEFAALVDAELAGGTGYAPYRTRTHLVRLGRYAEQVRRWHACVGAERVLVLLTEDLAADPVGSLRKVADHIGVDPDVPLTLDQRYNTTGAGAPAGWAAARRVVRRIQPAAKSLLPPRLAGRLAELRAARFDAGLGPSAPVPADVAARIAAWCADDTAELAQLLGRDLSAWTAAPGS